MNLRQASERAVVGALLVDPARYDDVRAWLQPEDFLGAAEGHAYAAIRSLRERGGPADPQSVHAELQDTLRPGQGPDAPWLHTVMAWTPDPARAVVYGRMVLELAIRRHVTDTATSLRQHGESAAATEDLNQVFATVDQLRRGIERLHTREATASGVASPTPVLPGQPLPGLTRRHRAEHHEAEHDLILTLVDRPAALPTVTAWLRTSDFDDDEAGLLYGEITALSHARNPIDRLTVAWRAEKVGIAGPLCELLTDPRPMPVMTGDPVLLARRVLDQSVQAAVLATSDELDRIAANPAAPATSHAYARLNQLWPQQRRLTRAKLGLPD